MHERYAGKGLVCMSVSVDPPESQEDALKFLTRKKATFANYRIDEESDVWSQRWGIAAPPALFVFDRQGRRAARFAAEEKAFTDADVEKVVQRLLGP
jgi:hypothetical protein